MTNVDLLGQRGPVVPQLNALARRDADDAFLLRHTRRLQTRDDEAVDLLKVLLKTDRQFHRPHAGLVETHFQIAAVGHLPIANRRPGNLQHSRPLGDADRQAANRPHLDVVGQAAVEGQEASFDRGQRFGHHGQPGLALGHLKLDLDRQAGERVAQRGPPGQTVAAAGCTDR